MCRRNGCSSEQRWGCTDAYCGGGLHEVSSRTGSKWRESGVRGEEAEREIGRDRMRGFALPDMTSTKKQSCAQIRNEFSF